VEQGSLIVEFAGMIVSFCCSEDIETRFEALLSAMSAPDEPLRSGLG
jgi:hypothetical protein